MISFSCEIACLHQNTNHLYCQLAIFRSSTSLHWRIKIECWLQKAELCQWIYFLSVTRYVYKNISHYKYVSDNYEEWKVFTWKTIIRVQCFFVYLTWTRNNKQSNANKNIWDISSSSSSIERQPDITSNIYSVTSNEYSIKCYRAMRAYV